MAVCSKATLLALALLLAAFLYQWYRTREGGGSDDGVASHVRKSGKKRILIGVNADVDFILPAVDLLAALGAAPGNISDHAAIFTVEELQETVAYSMATCSGVERPFGNMTLYDVIVQVASNLSHEEALGGNAGLMAQQIASTTVDNEVMLVAPIGPRVRQYLHDRILLPPNEPSVEEEEEVHIILEYPKGQQWGEVTAVCANRVIISNDMANSMLKPLEQFGQAVATFQPDLVVFSGQHMLEGQPRGYWELRMRDMVTVLRSVPRHSPLHMEMATVGDRLFMHHLAEEVFPYVDSLGLNEQELLMLAKSANTSFNFTDIGSKPSIPYASDLLHWMYSTYTSHRRKRESRLSRIHFHSLTFHILVHPTRDLAGSRWMAGVEAVMAGSRQASLQACNTSEITPDKFELLVPKSFHLSHTDETLSRSPVDYEPDNGYVAWQREGLDYFLSPVHVCRKPLKTVGLGDAISSTGLLHSEFLQAKRRFRKD